MKMSLATGYNAGKRLPVLLLSCCLLCIHAYPQSIEAAALGQARRGFKGVISLSMASLAAITDARLQAMEQAVRELAGREEVKLFLSSEAMREAPRPEPLALAWSLLEREDLQSRVEGIPPDMQVLVNLNVSLASGKESPEMVRQLLTNNELLQIYSAAIILLRDALAAYDGAALVYLIPGVSAEKGRGASPDDTNLTNAYKRLEAANNFLGLIPSLYPTGQDTDLPDVNGTLLEKLKDIAAQYPDNFFILSELARLYLLGGHTPAARANLDRAISLEPGYAIAYNRRGMVMLLQELPALALKDFDRAISLEPYHPVFYENRALAHRVMEDTKAMCLDLAESCKLGECGGLEWAKAEGMCAQP